MIRFPYFYVRSETAQAYKLECPLQSPYARYSFWIPKTQTTYEAPSGVAYLTFHPKENQLIQISRRLGRGSMPQVKTLSPEVLSQCFEADQQLLIRRIEAMQTPIWN